MKYFVTVQKYGALSGIIPTRKLFNRRVLIIFLLLAVNSAMTCAFPILEPLGFEEYIIAIYAGSGTAMVTVVFAIIAFKTASIYTLFGSVDDIAQSSEY